MIKLYDLISEANKAKGVTRLRNNLDLGDKNEEFQEKLDTMSSGDQNVLIPFVRRLIKKGDSRIEEFKNLLNRFPKVEDLEAPKTPLELNIARIKDGTSGPGELLFHLELQDSKMDVGSQTNHDLIVKGKVWEVKKVSKNGGPFRLAKKGAIGTFKVGRDLYKMVEYLDQVSNMLPRLKEDFKDISPRLLKALGYWTKIVSNKYSPREAILNGAHSEGFRRAMIKIIDAVKDEIEVNTDDEFTYVKFGGVNVGSKEKGINPVNIQKIDDDSVLLNFIGRDTLEVLEILNKLPYVEEGDFNTEMRKNIVIQALKDMPSMIIFSYEGTIAIFDKTELVDNLEFSNITQQNLTLNVKPEVWEKL